MFSNYCENLCLLDCNFGWAFESLERLSRADQEKLGESFTFFVQMNYLPTHPTYQPTADQDFSQESWVWIQLNWLKFGTIFLKLSKILKFLMKETVFHGNILLVQNQLLSTKNFNKIWAASKFSRSSYRYFFE